MAVPGGAKLLHKAGSKIVAIGRNYAAHAKELGNAVPTEPFFFLKPPSSVIYKGASIEVPPPLTEVHHEVELGVVIGKPGRDIRQAQALEHVAGYALVLDMTARELQAAAKAKGLPWTRAKGYDTFCPVSDFIPKADVPDPANLELWLEVDGVEKQRGSTSGMIFDIPFLISHVSTVMALQEGDLILTGTPEGVGPVTAGQNIRAGITGLITMAFPVVERPLGLK